MKEIKGFYRNSKAWYSDALIEKTSITIGLYFEPDEGTEGEFSIEWEDLEQEPVARLKVYEDAWHILYKFQDLLKMLNDLANTNPSEQTITEELIKIGYKDLTPYKRTNE